MPSRAKLCASGFSANTRPARSRSASDTASRRCSYATACSQTGTPHHVAVDPHQETRFADCGRQFLDEAGVTDLVEHHAEESQIALPRFLAEGRSFDLAFVDGNHRFDGVFLDLVHLGGLVRPGGVVFVDDCQLRSVARAVALCTTNLGWTTEEVSTDDDLHHWTVLRTARIAPHRAYDHYVDF
jgi:predicted O-methyltransferase YrrM